jgi:hypothetical protein
MIDPLEHFIYKIRNAEFRSYPFSHVFIKDVFPDDYYRKIRGELEQATKLDRMAEYPNRLFSCELSDEIKQLFGSPGFGAEVVRVFDVKNCEAMIRWTRDSKGYFLDPHTDAKKKKATLLFYMPNEKSQGPWGTSLYLPKNRKFTSDGRTHHKREDFDLIYTFPFEANSMLGISRTDSSWHGVEPILEDIQRDSLFYTANEKTS